MITKITKGATMAYNELNEEGTYVILNKGTERSFTGKFWDHHEDGMYICRQCNADYFPQIPNLTQAQGGLVLMMR